MLIEDAADWFESEEESPYMTFVSQVCDKKRSKLVDRTNKVGFERLKTPLSSIPAVTHVNYSARVQTVHKETNPLFHRLITQFKADTGCPILINTSFNVRGEPIVNTPIEAFDCFMGTEMDLLVIGNCILEKSRQSSRLITDHASKFEQD